MTLPSSSVDLPGHLAGTAPGKPLQFKNGRTHISKLQLAKGAQQIIEVTTDDIVLSAPIPFSWRYDNPCDDGKSARLEVSIRNNAAPVDSTAVTLTYENSETSGPTVADAESVYGGLTKFTMPYTLVSAAAPGDTVDWLMTFAGLPAGDYEITYKLIVDELSYLVTAFQENTPHTIPRTLFEVVDNFTV
jgi:hypothetical protein